MKKYDSYFKNFKDWTFSTKLPSLPTTYETLAVFIMYHLQLGSSFTVIESYIYAIKWHHNTYVPNDYDPTEHKTIKNLIEAYKRLRPHLVNKKEPITTQHLAAIFRSIGGNNAPLNLFRTYTMMLVAFSGFFKI